MKDIIKQLREDKEYYGSFGKSYLSNSDIGVLLNNPKMYGVKREDNLNFMKGRLFHQILLEPSKTKDWNVVDVSSRNTKAYKEQVVKQAEGVAQNFVDVYNSYKDNKEVTRRRIYLETLREVLEGENKIILDDAGGQGVVPYLPLNELKKGSNN